jgi:uncharacterized protein (DUF697 family)
MSIFETYEYEQEGEYGELGSEMETELAAELLEITNEQELEQFLGDIVKSVGSFIRGPVGQAVGGVLKQVAKTALPAVGGALGSFVAPGIGTAIGSQLGSMASSALGEYEVAGEQEFEVARKVVQLAQASAQHAASAPPDVPPQAVAEQAVARAAQQVMPGIRLGGGGPQMEQMEQMEQEYGHGRRGSRGYRSRGYGTYGTYGVYGGDGDDGGYDEGPSARTGRWVRRGRRIILFGVY